MTKEEYHEYLLSSEWKQRENGFLDREGRWCRFCGSQNSILAHHLTYEHIGNESDWDLVPICYRHHKILHKAVNECVELVGSELQRIDQERQYLNIRNYSRLLVKIDRWICKIFGELFGFNYAGIKYLISTKKQKPRMESIVRQTIECSLDAYVKKNRIFRNGFYGDKYAAFMFAELEAKGFPRSSSLLRIKMQKRPKQGDINSVEEWNEEARKAVERAVNENVDSLVRTEREAKRGSA